MIDRLTLIKQRHLVRLRNLEAHVEAHIQALEPELHSISEEIVKIEVGNLFWVIGPGGKLFRCEKTE